VVYFRKTPIVMHIMRDIRRLHESSFMFIAISFSN